MRDSESGVEKMLVGRHLNERGHVVTRARNTRTQEMNEDQDYINLDESQSLMCTEKKAEPPKSKVDCEV